ncbi:hypothetical protein KUTeg_023777 [Tegillarca granosa]|uniref:Uncharacterized protein n=1 Tax=Tegillarca granosa TaxID=220873 RepID=A0ABQ9E754_TEGGR|nr:hypothetical protein KUTeg_023777 [Tegillarca granosa]
MHDYAEKGDKQTQNHLDFLDILLTAKDTDGKGYGTTASAATWILFSLAQNPEYQEKAQKEIDKIMEGRDIDDIECF